MLSLLLVVTVLQEMQDADAEDNEGAPEDRVEVLEQAAEHQSKVRITTRYMTKYERARILGTRALQIRCLLCLLLCPFKTTSKAFWCSKRTIVKPFNYVCCLRCLYAHRVARAQVTASSVDPYLLNYY